MNATKKVIITGFATFAMLFGSGNIVFPLILGRDAGHHLFFALAGFLLTAVLLPLVGIFATMLYHGDYQALLAPLGKLPAFLVAAICMTLIGPFAVIPRCLTLSHAALHMHLPWLGLGLFSLFAATIIFAATVRNSLIMDLLGKFLGPIKIGLLFTIVIKGLFMPSHFIHSSMSSLTATKLGLLSGYGTCDLIATIFLSGLIVSKLQRGMNLHDPQDSRRIILWGVQASIIAGSLLGLVYGGFCLVSGFHGNQLQGVPQADLFSHVAYLVLGEKGGLFADITIAVSCLTTAIALTAVFAMYLHQNLFRGKLAYIPALIITIIIGSSLSLVGFDAIMHILKPILGIIYPFLILFVLVAIFLRIQQFKQHQPVDLSIDPESSDWGEK